MCRYNQHLMVKNMLALQQMTYDLMGIQKNAYEDHFSGLNEDAVKAFSIKNKLTSFTRTLYQKIRYVKYMCGDMDAAAKHYDLQQELYANCAGQATTGEFGLYYGLVSFCTLFILIENSQWVATTNKFRPNVLFLHNHIHRWPYWTILCAETSRR